MLLLLAFFDQNAELGGVEQQELIEVDPFLLGTEGPPEQLSDPVLLLLDRPLLSDDRLLKTLDCRGLLSKLTFEACSLGLQQVPQCREIVRQIVRRSIRAHGSAIETCHRSERFFRNCKKLAREPEISTATRVARLPLDVREVDAFEQHRQLRRQELDLPLILADTRPREPALFEPLIPHG